MNLNNLFQKYIKISINYFIISGIVTILAIIYNYVLIDKLYINLNLTFLSSFLIFGFLSYFFNAKLNFKQKTSTKKFFVFLQNNAFALILTLILANLIVKFELLSNFYMVCVITFFNATLNFLLNINTTFKLN